MYKPFNVTKIINGTKYLCKEVIAETQREFIIGPQFLYSRRVQQRGSTTTIGPKNSKSLRCIIDHSYNFVGDVLIRFFEDEYSIGLKIFLIILIVVLMFCFIFVILRVLSHVKSRLKTKFEERKNEKQKNEITPRAEVVSTPAIIEGEISTLVEIELNNI